MIDVPIEPWWRRTVNFTPVAATLGGIAFGAALGCVLAFQCFDRVSRDLSLFLTLMGGAWGYMRHDLLIPRDRWAVVEAALRDLGKWQS
jgi:hypothetical protein